VWGQRHGEAILNGVATIGVISPSLTDQPCKLSIGRGGIRPPQEIDERLRVEQGDALEFPGSPASRIGLPGATIG
jgi:hypothetical protein